MRFNYQDAQAEWGRRAKGRDYKRWSTYLRLRQDGQDFIITGRHSSESLVRIAPNNMTTVYFAQMRGYLGNNSVVYHLHRYFGVDVFHKLDHRSSQRWWFWHAGGHIPIGDTFQINRFGHVVDGVQEVKRKRVDLQKAKPIRERIAAWEKLARTYFAAATPETVVAQFEEARKLPKIGWPGLDEEPSVDEILRLGDLGYSYYLRNAPAENAAAHIRSSFYTSFTRWKYELYEKAGAMVWKPLDKAA